MAVRVNVVWKNDSLQMGVDSSAHDLSKAIKGLLDLPAEQTRHVCIQSTEEAYNPHYLEPRHARALRDMREDHPADLVCKLETPRTEEGHEQRGVEDRGGNGVEGGRGEPEDMDGRGEGEGEESKKGEDSRGG